MRGIRRLLVVGEGVVVRRIIYGCKSANVVMRRTADGELIAVVRFTRREATLEPAPANAFGVKQVANVLTVKSGQIMTMI